MACTSSPSPAHVAIGAPTVTSVVQHVAPAPHVESCDEFRSRMKIEIGKALASHPPRYPGMDAEQPSTLVGFCAETPRGSWRVEMPDWKSAESFEEVSFRIESSFAVVHVDRDGTEARFSTEATLYDYGVREAKTPVLFDFDGDGEPEIFLDVREDGPEGHRARQNALLTFLGGAVVPFAPAKSFDVDVLEDVDKDGRPDLKIFAGYTDTLDSCFSGFPYDHPPARFVAHSLPGGGFSVEDAVAKAYARAWCPSSPATLDDSTDAICARMWSADNKEITREGRRVAASCVSGYCDREVKNQPQPPLSSPDCGRRQQWFEHAPPLTLP